MSGVRYSYPHFHNYKIIIDYGISQIIKLRFVNFTLTSHHQSLHIHIHTAIRVIINAVLQNILVSTHTMPSVVWLQHDGGWLRHCLLVYSNGTDHVIKHLPQRIHHVMGLHYMHFDQENHNTRGSAGYVYLITPCIICKNTKILNTHFYKTSAYTSTVLSLYFV